MDNKTIEIEIKANIYEFMAAMERATDAVNKFRATFRTLTTYRRADGETIYGEYDWAVDPKFFDEDLEPIEVIKETWRLINSETMMFGETYES